MRLSRFSILTVLMFLLLLMGFSCVKAQTIQQTKIKIFPEVHLGWSSYKETPDGIKANDMKGPFWGITLNTQIDRPGKIDITWLLNMIVGDYDFKGTDWQKQPFRWKERNYLIFDTQLKLQYSLTSKINPYIGLGYTHIGLRAKKYLLPAKDKGILYGVLGFNLKPVDRIEIDLDCEYFLWGKTTHEFREMDIFFRDVKFSHDFGFGYSYKITGRYKVFTFNEDQDSVWLTFFYRFLKTDRTESKTVSFGTFYEPKTEVNIFGLGIMGRF